MSLNQEQLDKMTNQEFLKWVMNFSAHGALAEVFIIEAVRFYSEKVANQPKPEDDGNSFISPVAWHELGCEINEKVKSKYEKQS